MKKQILFISHRIPYPPNKGDKIRSFNELKYFSTLYDIDLVTFYDTVKDVVHETTLKRYCKSVYLFHLKKLPSLVKGMISLLFGGSISVGCYKDKNVGELVKSLLQKNSYDFIFCYSSQVIQYALSANIPKIIDFIDLDSDKWRQYAKKSIFPLNIIYHIEFKRLAKFEKKAWQEFSLSVFSTGQEVKLFEKYGISNEKVTVLGNGVDHQFFSPIYCKRIKALTFTGAMDYLPNIDAVTWFCKSIFPEILRAVPDVKFYIVGSNPPKEIQTLASDSVIVTGFVDDIRTYIAQSWLAVYPLRIARGIQNKILEAMAMGITPVVPESLRSSLDDAWPQEVLFFNSENDCISLIIDSLRRFNPDAPVCDNLRKYILTKRDWTRRLDAFQTLVKDLVQ